MKQAAIDYAGRGWLVFPLGVRSKLPMISRASGGRGFYDAATDPVVIAAWWSRWPAANIGIRTGASSGIFVVDVDADHGGELSLARLIRDHGAPPDTLTSRTGGGGRHLLFAWPGGELRNSASHLGDGIDIRGEGGYIVAPPSHTAKGEYRWVNPQTSVAPAPAWLLARLRKPVPTPLVSVPRAAVARFSGDILRDKADQVRSATPRARNHTLNAVAYSLGRLVGAGILDEAAVTAELVDAARASGLEEREILATIRSGLTAGTARPRAVAEA